MRAQQLWRDHEHNDTEISHHTRMRTDGTALIVRHIVLCEFSSYQRRPDVLESRSLRWSFDEVPSCGSLHRPQTLSSMRDVHGVTS